MSGSVCKVDPFSSTRTRVDPESTFSIAYRVHCRTAPQAGSSPAALPPIAPYLVKCSPAASVTRRSGVLVAPAKDFRLVNRRCLISTSHHDSRQRAFMPHSKAWPRGGDWTGNLLALHRMPFPNGRLGMTAARQGAGRRYRQFPLMEQLGRAFSG